MSRARHTYRPGDYPVPGYRLIESLGRGNFGEAWLTSAPGGMEVALKIIDLSGREGVKEFEALQRVKHIHHPNLVPIVASWLLTEDGQVLDDLSDAATSDLLKKRTARRPAAAQDPGDGNLPRLVELIIAMGLGSRSLAARLEECLNAGLPGIPHEELLEYMEGAARGIDYLNQPIHDLGEGLVPIIHGDIKPHNILIVGNAVQVADFGLVRAIQTLRKTSTGMGTFAYAAPELLEGKASRMSDQYCLAVTYVELCTGELPFSETNPLKVVELHRRGDLDLSTLQVREREVIRRATAVDPDLRWPSCSVMVRALRQACDADAVAPDGASAAARAASAGDSTLSAPAPPASLAGTLVVPTARATGPAPAARRIAETVPVGSMLTARGQPPRTLLLRPALWIAFMLLLMGGGVGAYLAFFPRQREPSNDFAGLTHRKPVIEEQPAKEEPKGAEAERDTEMRMEAISNETDPQGVVSAVASLSKDHPLCAAQAALTGIRTLVRRAAYEPASRLLGQYTKQSPSELRRLSRAMELVVEYQLTKDLAKAKHNLAAYDEACQSPAPSEQRWQLTKSEVDLVEDIRSKVKIEQADIRTRLMIAEQLKSIQQDLLGPDVAKVDKALDMAERLLLSGKLDDPQAAIRLYQALAKVSAKKHLDRAATLIRNAHQQSVAPREAVAALADLWRKRIEDSVRNGEEKLEAMFALFEADREFLERPGEGLHEGLIDAWQQEALLEGGRRGELKPILDVDTLPKNLILYGRYVRARCLEAAAVRDRTNPDWSAIAEDLARVFQKPGAPEIVDVPMRRTKAVELGVKAANTIRKQLTSQQQLTPLGGPLLNPFSPAAAAGRADRCYRLLKGIYALDPTLLNVETRITLVLAAFCQKERDSEIVSKLTSALKDAALGPDTARVLYAYLKTNAGKRENQPEIIDAGTRLCKLLVPNQPRTGDTQELYEQVLRPVELLADGMLQGAMTTSNPAQLVKLVDFYDGFYALLAEHKSLPWPVEGQNIGLERLVTKAIEAEKKLPGPFPADAVHSANRYLERAQLRLGRQSPELNPVLEDIEQARKLVPSTDAANGPAGQAYFTGNGLACQAYLMRARLQPARQQQVADLTEAIESGRKAVTKCTLGVDKLATYLLCLSCACVERANCDKRNQEDDLRQAHGIAQQAAELMNQGQSDFPYLALGNALEDIAWRMEFEPEKNYLAAIEAFKEATHNESVEAEAYCSIGRCYYRMVYATCLYPGVENQAKRDDLMATCKGALQKAVELDEYNAEAHRFLGLAYQYEGQYGKADKSYEAAKSAAARRKLPTLAIYIAQWARFPLENTALKPNEQAAEAMRRAAQLLQTPPPPGATLEPLDEEAWIRAEVAKRGGDTAAAKSICDARFAALQKTGQNVGEAEFGLLLARAGDEAELAKKGRNAALAQAAVDDAERAAQAALLPDMIASARDSAAIARYEAYSITEDRRYLDQAINDWREAIRLAPRRPIAARWCGYVVVCLRKKPKFSETAGPSVDKYDLLSEIIDLENNSLQWEINPTQLIAWQNEIAMHVKMGVKSVTALLNPGADAQIPPANIQQIQGFRKATQKWKNDMLPRIPSRVNGRAELATQLDALEQTLRGR